MKHFFLMASTSAFLFVSEIAEKKQSFDFNLEMTFQIQFLIFFFFVKEIWYWIKFRNNLNELDFEKNFTYQRKLPKIK